MCYEFGNQASDLCEFNVRQLMKNTFWLVKNTVFDVGLVFLVLLVLGTPELSLLNKPHHQLVNQPQSQSQGQTKVKTLHKYR